MDNEKKIFGAQGEHLAVDFLKRRHYKILEKNYKSIFGEIDVIAYFNNSIHFVEVKTRKNSFIAPEISVDYKKQSHIIKTALHYLTSKKIKDKDCSFDIVSIILPDSGKPSVTFFENAFTCNERF